MNIIKVTCKYYPSKVSKFSWRGPWNTDWYRKPLGGNISEDQVGERAQKISSFRQGGQDPLQYRVNGNKIKRNFVWGEGPHPKNILVGNTQGGHPNCKCKFQYIPVHFPVQFHFSSIVKFQNSSTFQNPAISEKLNSSTFQYTYLKWKKQIKSWRPTGDYLIN